MIDEMGGGGSSGALFATRTRLEIDHCTRSIGSQW